MNYCCKRGAAAGSARGLSKLSGVFTSTTNETGGTVWTSVGSINQKDIRPLVNSGLFAGDVNIISGVHGFLDGSTIPDLNLYTVDEEYFKGMPGVNVYDFTAMTPSQITGLLNGTGTTIGGFCNSGVCLAPFK
jgi:hypothetical protein